MRAALALSLAALNVAACWSLQFVYPPTGRAFGSERSREHSATDNAIVIHSKAYNVTDNATEPAQTRRTVVVQREDPEENYAEPKVPQYAIDCGGDKACLEAHGMDAAPEATFRPYTQEELERLLAQYAASQGRPSHVDDDSPVNKLANLYMDEEDAVINVLENNPKSKDQEKSKSASSWHLLQAQKHNHPLDDQKGWVTLEPVPWAQSQIQKWEPNAKPQIPSWDPPSHQRPTASWGSRPSQDYPPERPWNKPSYEYKPSRPQWSQWTRPSDTPSHWSQDIITDNQPGYFPSKPQSSQKPWYDQEPYGSNRPPQTYEDRPLHQGYSSHPGHPASHPSEGDGQWVLLSSTKGYSVPHRHRGAFQRSLTFGTKAPTVSVSSHRTVRLTVLPADNSTNTTLSHGGLLEVEQTLQTVEEAQREHAAKMLKVQSLKPEELTSTSTSTTTSPPQLGRRSGGAGLQVFSASPANPQSKAAMLAAIGAGMIPATVAMLLPMVLGRRRRSAPGGQRPVNNTLLEVLNLQRPRRSLNGQPTSY